MNQEYKLYRISQLLSRFREQVTILNSNGEFSINIHAENILIKVLNKVYNCNLKNVNYEEGKTYPSIDLRDTTGRIAIQVTSTANLEKVKHTLSKFIENNLYKEFDKLFIFIITQKQSKYDQTKINNLLNGLFTFEVKNIIDRTDIYKELNSQNDLEKINSVCVLLEKQFADNKKELDKWDLYCKGLHEYDQYICNLYNYLDIKGFSPKINNTLVKINLENIYVPLELKLETDFETGQEELKKVEKKIIYTTDKALNDFNNLVILGDPGSGKSTVLKYLARNICSKRAIESQFEGLVPIIVKGSEFAKYVSSTSKQLSEYVIDHIDKKYEILFTQKLENNQLLVLIDGIDEINITNLRHNVVNRINAFIAQYPKIKIIVSSRIVGYKETRLNGYFSHLQVIEFGKKQIQQFVKNWYLSISLNSDNDKDAALNKANELYESIRQNTSVLKMASNPLLVTIIALIHYQGNTLPEKRASLYDVATSTFLENWVRQRESKKSSNFDKDLLVEILAPISFHIHQNYTTGLISESELKYKLSEEYKKINPFLNLKEEKQDVKDIVEFLREDAGFLFEKGLDEKGESLFGFVHQTFQEYFTAIEFKTRWKEGNFKDNLDEYVFSSNWLEVIKLSASLFRLNEPSRLGRQYATNFIKDILDVKDPYPEIYRPLIVAIQILNDDTEIEFSYFIEIIDKIFNEVLVNDERSETDPYEHNREVSTFKFFIEELINTKTYQSYLIERIIKDVTNSKSSALKNNLVESLICKSDIPIVKVELIKILKSDKENLKSLIFNYNVVMPVARIAYTTEYREEIVKYVNSEEFIKNYNGHLPTQYQCCFEEMRERDFGTYLIAHFEKYSFDDLSQKIMDERLLSIRLIQNKKIREDFINYYVFSYGLGEVDNIKQYLECLKKEYPKIKLPKIEKHIEELEKFNSYNLHEYEIIDFQSVKIFSRKDSDSTYAFIKEEKIDFMEFPFNDEDLKPYFNKNSKSFSSFLSLIIPVINKSVTELSINTFENLLNFIEYQKTLHWHYDIDTGSVLNYALKNLFNKNNVNKIILNWVKNRQDIRRKKFELEDSFNKQEFKTKTISSKLELHDKLYLLHLVSEKSDYEDLIRPTIESLKIEKSENKKKEIKRVLYEVL